VQRFRREVRVQDDVVEWRWVAHIVMSARPRLSVPSVMMWS
jgi:hypothetical protein